MKVPAPSRGVSASSAAAAAAPPSIPALRRIIELLDKDDGTGELYWEGDLSHMHQVSKYIDCHRAALRAAGAAGPAGGGGGGGEEADRLRHRLMNYGFDPLKEREAGSGA